MEIRPATAADIADITRIFNQGIEDRIATFDILPKTLEERRAWFLDRQPKYKVIVSCEGSHITGWASLNQFSPRFCYDWVADVSVYVERESRGKGLGRALLTALTDLATEAGFYKMTLTVFGFNVQAIRSYRAAGFTEVGTYRGHGYFLGELANVVLMEKPLAYDKARIDQYYRDTYTYPLE